MTETTCTRCGFRFDTESDMAGPIHSPERCPKCGKDSTEASEAENTLTMQIDMDFLEYGPFTESVVLEIPDGTATEYKA